VEEKKEVREVRGGSLNLIIGVLVIIILVIILIRIL
jgi:hypothetical protein